MTGLPLNPAKADLSREGVLLKGTLHPRINIRAATRSLAPPARVKRILNGWMAAANAYRDRQTAWLAQLRAADRKLNNKRIYRGPIDDALEKAARLGPRRLQS